MQPKKWWKKRWTKWQHRHLDDEWWVSMLTLKNETKRQLVNDSQMTMKMTTTKKSKEEEEREEQPSVDEEGKT